MLTPRFLWPSLGRPVFISAAQPAFTACIAAPAGTLDAASLSTGFALTSVPDARRTLALRSAVAGDKVALPDTSPLRHVLVPSGRYEFYEVRLDVPAADIDAAVGDRRGGLFSLSHPDVAQSPHSVAWIRHGWDTFQFAFVTDTHLARDWERIEADALALESGAAHTGDDPRARLRRFFSREAFAASFVNPNRTWRDFVQEANARARRGELDLVVLGGDLVDYQEPGNVQHFVDSATGRSPGSLALEVPLVAVPGNHDYRRLGYRPQIYPLDRWGLHDLQRDHFFREVRGEGRTGLSLADIRTALSSDGGRHPLAGYLLHISPTLDAVLRMGRSTFVLLDTGRDVFRALHRVDPRRWGNYLRTLPHAWWHPASAGLTDDQAAVLTRESAAGDAGCLFVVFHAGLAGARIEACRRAGDTGPVVRTGDRGGIRSVRARAGLERAFLRSGLGPGGIFQNHSSLLRAAAAGNRAVLGLSGHMHRPVTLRFDKNSGDLFLERDGTGALTSSSFDHSSYFLNGPALGHVTPRADPPGRPGFLSVAVAGDGIVSVRPEALPGAGGEAFRVRVCRSRAEPRRPTITIDVDSDGDGGEPHPTAITFIVFSRPRRNAPGGFPYTIEPETPDEIQAGQPAWIDAKDRRTFIGDSGPAYLQSFRCDAAAGRAFHVSPAVRPFRRARAAVVVERLVPREGGWSPVRTSWHPLWIEL